MSKENVDLLPGDYSIYDDLRNDWHDSKDIINNVKQYDTEAEAEENAKDYIFVGMNCEEECFWNNGYHRCACGNRRVDFETIKLTNGKWICFAAAY